MIDLLVIATYLAIMLRVGWRARSDSADAYWVASRRFGGLQVSASLVATIFGASSTLGIIGLGYARGLTGAWWSLVGGIALLPFSFFLAARVRRLEVYTLPDILRKAYGERVALAGALVIALAWCGVVAAQIVAGALLLEGVFSVPFQGALGLVTVVFVLYTLWGGQTSVIRTDAWQILLFGGGLLATLVLLLRGGGGAGGLVADIPPNLLRFPVSPDFGWYQALVFYPLIIGLPYLVGPDIYSRVLCARDGETARRSGLVAAAVVLPLSFVLAFLGILIRARFPDLTPEAAFPAAVTALAPAGLKGIIVVGVLGAIMSSADTTLISASTILSLNVVSPLRKLDAPEQLRLTRFFVVVIGVLAWVVAAFEQGIIASLLLAYTVFVGGVVFPTLGSFWRQRLGISPSGAFWAILAGGVLAVLGEVQDGVILHRLLGEGGVGFLETLLGQEYGRILPLIASAGVLMSVGRRRGRPGAGAGEPQR
jgi:SSS family solute:Na+ symporter